MTKNPYRRRRTSFLGVILAIALALGGYFLYQEKTDDHAAENPAPVASENKNEAKNASQPLATETLEKLDVKGRAPKTGYARDQFGKGWAAWGKCDTRQRILGRDLTDVKYANDGCTVLSGTLNEPYTGKVVQFTRGASTSSAVQIDHVVALSDAWQKGAQGWDARKREQLANDDLELLAADGPANQQKGAGDAATWLPPNKSFRCTYVARQIAVKFKYALWVTDAEKTAMGKVLASCPDERLPAP